MKLEIIEPKMLDVVYGSKVDISRSLEAQAKLTAGQIYSNLKVLLEPDTGYVILQMPVKHWQELKELIEDNQA